MKGCICHLVKWQIHTHPFISKGIIYIYIYIYSVGPTSSTLVQHYINARQMVCVCWVTYSHCMSKHPYLFLVLGGRSAARPPRPAARTSWTGRTSRRRGRDVPWRGTDSAAGPRRMPPPRPVSAAPATWPRPCPAVSDTNLKNQQVGQVTSPHVATEAESLWCTL